MLKHEVQRSYQFEEMTSIQYGWQFLVDQLASAKEESRVDLYSTPHVAYTKIRYGTAYNQRVCTKDGFLSFGLLDADNSAIWSHDRLIPNDAINVLPKDDYLKGGTPVGFHGNGIHFSTAFTAQLAEQLYLLPLNTLVPAVGGYLPKPAKLRALRAELLKWQQLATFGADSRPEIVSRREESLVLAVFDVLYDASPTKSDSIAKADGAVSLALEMIHGSELENILARELCKHAGCSQRTLETGFLKRFGVTPKKYIKCLRLSQVHRGLRDSHTQGRDSIIEIAGIHGFWHMGQFAADYRAIYGELPSEAIKRR